MSEYYYKNNPLYEVILQIRFPKILSINSNDPIEFQEKIKKLFPIYRLKIENEQEMEFNPNTESIFLKGKKTYSNHNFISQDGHYKVNLTSDFIAISTNNYTKWDYLFEMFQSVFDSFQEIYQSPFFERIGLRYVNAFSKEKLMLGNALWKDVLNNNYIGALSFIPEQRVKNNNIAFEYELDEPTMRAKINAGLGTLNNVYKVFIFDCDLICIKQINKEEINGIIQTLHNNEVNIFEGFLSETLKQHMEPITSDE